jgi:hypothetical protein
VAAPLTAAELVAAGMGPTAASASGFAFPAGLGAAETTAVPLAAAPAEYGALTAAEMAAGPAVASGPAEYGALGGAAIQPTAGPAVPANIATGNALQQAGTWIGNNKMLTGAGILAATQLGKNSGGGGGKDPKSSWDGRSASWENGDSSGGTSSGRFSGSVRRYVEDAGENPYARSYAAPGSYTGARR